MEMKQIITATVAVILVCLVAIPLINDSTDSIRTVGMNSSDRYVVVDGEDTFRIESTGTIGTFIINGETQTVNYFRLLAETISIYLSPSSSEIAYPGMTGTVSFSTTAGNYIQFENGNWTLHTNTLDVTQPYNWILHSSETGNYGLYATTSSTAIMVDNDSKIYASQIQSVSGSTVTRPFMITSGTINDGFTGKYFSYVSGTSQTYNLTTVAKLNGEKGEISSELNSLTTEYNDTTFSPILLYVPLEYHYLSDMDSTTRTILSMIPILLVAAVIVGIGYSIARRE